MFPISWWNFWFIFHVYSIIQNIMVFYRRLWIFLIVLVRHVLHSDWEWLGHFWLGGLREAPPQGVSQWHWVVLSVFYWSAFIGSISAFATPSTYTWRLSPPIFAIPRWDVISRNSLSTIPSQIPYFTSFGILMSPHTFGNCFFYPRFSNITKCLNVHCMKDPFIHRC